MSRGPWSALFTSIAFIEHLVRKVFYSPFLARSQVLPYGPDGKLSVPWVCPHSNASGTVDVVGERTVRMVGRRMGLNVCRHPVSPYRWVQYSIHSSKKGA